MRIAEVLQAKDPDVVTVAAATPVRELVRVLAERNIGAVLVSDDAKTAHGIVSERDVVRRLTEGTGVLDLDTSAIMTSPVHTCGVNDSVDDVLRVMTEQRIRHVPVVVDEQVQGIVSIGDLVKSRIQQLEFERDQLSTYVNTAQ
jgi:CBS domain-containing protein